MAGHLETHLGMIQGVVNRLAQSSFLLKGWSVVLVSALVALAAGRGQAMLLGVAFLPAVCFWGLDAYYLWQERLFRALYDHVRNLDDLDCDYTLDTRTVPNLTSYHRWWAAVCSRTIVLFHGAVLATICIMLLVIE